MQIDYLAVGSAALAAFLAGFVWYTLLFQRVWQKLIGMRDEDGNLLSVAQTPRLGVLLIVSLVLELVMALVLSRLIGADADWSAGLATGAAVGAGIVAAAFGVIFLFEGKPWRLWSIHAGFYTVVFALMGLIIGAF